MRTTLSFLAILASCPLALTGQQAADLNPQRLAFVGDPAAQRTKAYVAFLQQRFAAVEVFARDHDDPGKLQEADVVLLDWPQSDAARAERSRHFSPLGPRANWHTPTVLLGSAGLNLAGAWEVRGGFG
jgi:hypothetical protein